MVQILVREARKADMQAVERMHTELDRHDRGYWPHPIPNHMNSRKWLSKSLKKKAAIVFVAEDRPTKEKVGFLLGWIEEWGYHLKVSRWGYCSDLFVAKGYRRMGVGRKLLAAFAKWTRRKKLGYVVLTTSVNNADARRFYGRLGFREFEIMLRKRA